MKCEPLVEKVLEMPTLKRKQMLTVRFVLGFVLLCCLFIWYCAVGIKFLQIFSSKVSVLKVRGQEGTALSWQGIGTRISAEPGL